MMKNIIIKLNKCKIEYKRSTVVCSHKSMKKIKLKYWTVNKKRRMIKYPSLQICHTLTVFVDNLKLIQEKFWSIKEIKYRKCYKKTCERDYILF